MLTIKKRDNHIFHWTKLPPGYLGLADPGSQTHHTRHASQTYHPNIGFQLWIAAGIVHCDRSNRAEQ